MRLWTIIWDFNANFTSMITVEKIRPTKFCAFKSHHPHTSVPVNPLTELYLLFCMCITMISHGNNFLWRWSNKRNFCVNVDGTQMREA